MYRFCAVLPWFTARRTSVTLCVLMLGLWSFQIAGSCQTPSAPGDETITSILVEPETEEFQSAVVAFRDNLKEMRRVVIHYSVGDESEDRGWKEKWLELRATGVGLHQAMIDAAVAEYKTDPEEKKQIAGMLYKILTRNVGSDRYEGMLAAAQALSDAGYPEEGLQDALTTVALGMNEYDIVKSNLDQLLERGGVSDVLLRVQGNLDEISADWLEELAAREQDRTGEPLPRVLIRTTKGDMEVELFENHAPDTVGNFISLVELGFYRNLSFHRVLEHFMAHGGCPTGDGTSGPDYQIYGEMGKLNARKFFRGTLGVALSNNAPNSGGSQFFITFLPIAELNGQYTAFGRVVKGIDVLPSLQRIDPDAKKDKKPAATVMPDEIIEMRVLSKRNHEYKPNKVQP